MKRKVKIISILMLLVIIILLPKSNAALVSKPGTSVLVNTTVSNSYLLCQGMKGVGESLYGAGSNVQPHLSTNKDWGAVSYLSNSIYGTNTAGKNTGLKVTIGGKEYYSTNGNTSGVMNWGSNPNNTHLMTQSSGIINNYMDAEDKPDSNYDAVEELSNAAKNNSIFVDALDYVNKGMAMQETKTISYGKEYQAFCGNLQHPISIRLGLFGYGYGNQFIGFNGWCEAVRGIKNSDATFRPVVWN